VTGGRTSGRADERLGQEQLPLAWRIFLVNAAVFAGGIVVLAISPATVSSPIELAELLVLAVGLSAILLANLFLVRRSLAPLDRLRTLMRGVDLLQPGDRAVLSGPPEVYELASVFNEMLARLEQERHESGRQALEAQEAERKHVAQELHDEVGQSVTAVMLQLGRLTRQLPPELHGDLREAQEATRACLDDVRRIARRLRPEALDDLGLAPALIALSSAFAERTGLRVKKRLTNDLPQLSPEAELAVFRVAQESLTNFARHSGSSLVELQLERVEQGLLLRVRDYGRGLNGERRAGGIRGMRERALLIGADLSVESHPDGGVEVRLLVPAMERR